MHGKSASADADRDKRAERAADWAASRLGVERVELIPVSGDASFRRYFRCHAPGGPRILMDAPPEHEDSAPFVDIAARLRGAGLYAPEIMECDLQRGFLLLEDLGDTLYRDILDESSADRLFGELFDVLAAMAGRVDAGGLPEYGPGLLQQELDLFTDWYLGRHKRRAISSAERSVWNDLCERLRASAAAQPRVFVHRDFHSSNLLHTDRGPGIVDFQDAVRGPVSYDFISLIWDRYIDWPRKRLEGWMLDVRPRLAPGTGEAEWIRWCDWMGVQRNLKVVGIFARLEYRDGKDGYLGMVPRFFGYLRDVLPRYPEFAEFADFLEQAECAP